VAKRAKNVFGQDVDRVSIIQRCLVEEVLPRLMFDMPKPRSDKQRASLRVVTNYVATLIEGNEKFLKEQK